MRPITLAEAADNLNRIAGNVGELEKNYNELLMAVARKFPGETRHQTALRYIQEAEKSAESKAWEQHKSDRLADNGR